MPAIRKTFFCFLIAILFFLCGLLPNKFAQTRKDTAQTDIEGWKSIFDGRTLNGWKTSSEGFFSVEDGAITGKVAREHDGTVQRVAWRAGAKSGEQPRAVSPFIVWQGGNVTDFRLRFKCRLTGRVAHAGVHFRSRINGKELTNGYQADIPEWIGFFEGLQGKRPFENFAQGGESNLINKQGEKTVTRFGEKYKLLEAMNFQQWTDYEIIARGPYIIIEINGLKIAELIDHSKGNAAQAGILAISLHPLGDIKVQLRDIELKVLSPNLADEQETSQIARTINLTEEIYRELNSGSPQKALTLLQQNPQLINSMSGSRTNATRQGSAYQSPLLIASARGHVEVVKWLIANGAAINPESYNKFLPIHRAANAEIARLLIGAGADLKALADFQMTPLQYAAQTRRLDVVEAIIESGHRMDLISAILLRRSDLVAEMIQNNPSAVSDLKLTEKEKTGLGLGTPLMVAVRQGEKEIVELLLNAGADVNEKYDLMFRSGPPHCGTVTALSIAVVHQKIDLIVLLLRYGANPKVDCDGNSLLEYAKKHRTPEIVALLEKEWPKKPR